MLRLNENIEEQTTPQEELDAGDYLTRADVSVLVDEQSRMDASIATVTNDITSAINSLGNSISFKEMVEEAVKNYLEEMKNATS